MYIVADETVESTNLYLNRCLDIIERNNAENNDLLSKPPTAISEEWYINNCKQNWDLSQTVRKLRGDILEFSAKENFKRNLIEEYRLALQSGIKPTRLYICTENSDIVFTRDIKNSKSFSTLFCNSIPRLNSGEFYIFNIGQDPLDLDSY